MEQKPRIVMLLTQYTFLSVHHFPQCEPLKTSECRDDDERLLGGKNDTETKDERLYLWCM